MYYNYNTYPVPANELYPVLVHDPDDTRWMDPGLAVHLDRNSLVAKDPDDDRTALSYPVTLQVHDAGGAHVDGAEHRYNLQ